MPDRLDELEAMLRDGIKLSGQTSLGRRAPARASWHILGTVGAALRDYLTAHPEDSRGWRLLSLAEETVLSYPPAITALKRAIALTTGAPDPRDLKRLAALRATAKEWDALRLTAIQLAELGAFLDAQSDLTASFAFTRSWLETAGLAGAEADRVISVLETRGARCDADVAEIARGTWI